MSNILFKRTTLYPKKTVCFAPRKLDKLEKEGIDLMTINNIQVGSFQKMQEMGRSDLQYWPIDSIVDDKKDLDFYVTQAKKGYIDLGYEIVPFTNYQDNF